MPWRRQMADTPLEGVFRRQIDLRAWDEQTAVGWLEDEHHHFGITLLHDGRRIREVRMAAPRYPWATCAEAGHPLQALIGKPLVRRCTEVGAMLDMRRQCTHLFDLVSLLVAHALSGRTHRRYHGTVQALRDDTPGAPPDWLRATLQRDGQDVMSWILHDDLIMAPEPYAGRRILHGFRQWLETRGEVEAEDAFVLRRVAFVSNGRKISIEGTKVAAEMGQGPVCHTFQPEFQKIAWRMGNTTRRFDTSENEMLGLLQSKP